VLRLDDLGDAVRDQPAAVVRVVERDDVADPDCRGLNDAVDRERADAERRPHGA
jgi:hypothetical protein